MRLINKENTMTTFLINQTLADAMGAIRAANRIDCARLSWVDSPGKAGLRRKAAGLLRQARALDARLTRRTYLLALAA